MKKVLTIFLSTFILLISCSRNGEVYNTTNHGYRHGRKTRYYRYYRGYAHRGDFNKGFNGSGWESR
jgi:hypothetical protein